MTDTARGLLKECYARILAEASDGNSAADLLRIRIEAYLARPVEGLPEPQACPICDGSGNVYVSAFDQSTHTRVSKSCHACRGKGKLEPSADDYKAAAERIAEERDELKAILEKANKLAKEIDDALAARVRELEGTK